MVNCHLLSCHNSTIHNTTTHKKYKSMEAWGWDVPRLIVRYEVIHATKGKLSQSFWAQNSCEDHNACILGGRRSTQNWGARGPSLPSAVRVNQSCLTAEIWLHSVIQYLSEQKGQHTVISESGTESGIEEALWYRVGHLIDSGGLPESAQDGIGWYRVAYYDIGWHGWRLIDSWDSPESDQDDIEWRGWRGVGGEGGIGL